MNMFQPGLKDFNANVNRPTKKFLSDISRQAVSDPTINIVKKIK